MVAAIVGVSAYGLGGYAPWAALVIQLGAIALTGVVVTTVLFRTSRRTRETNRAIAKRHSWFGPRTSTEVEFVTPNSSSGVETAEREAPEIRFRDPIFWWGYSFRRTGGEWIAVGLTAWLALSILPLTSSLLSVVSPRALSLRAEAMSLVGSSALEWAPTSLTPFLTFQDLLLWIAYVCLFWVTFHLAQDARSVTVLSMGIVLLGVASGLFGLGQWLSVVSSSLDAPGGDVTATGTFGNRNHFAYFQEMTLLVGAGFLLWMWRASQRRAPDRVARQEETAKSAVLGVGVLVTALALAFSLSRSGITFAFVGGAILFFLARASHSSTGASASHRIPVAVGIILCLLAGTFWIGIDPIVNRFELLPTELDLGEEGRVRVWRDSLSAVSDFWLTGAGASSFQYVFPIYRSFGGPRFYSWAHNDYLQALVELGVPGFLLVLALLIWSLRRAVAVHRRLKGSSFRDLHAGYCAALGAVALHSFTDFGLHLPANAALAAVVLGIVTGLSIDKRSRRRVSRTKRKKLRRSPPSA